MAENFPTLGNKTSIYIQRAQGFSNNMNPKRPTPRHTIIKMSEAKEESLKTSKRKTTCAEDTHKPRSRFLDRNFAGQKGAAWNIQSAERKNSPAKNTLPGEAVTQN